MTFCVSRVWQVPTQNRDDGSAQVRFSVAPMSEALRRGLRSLDGGRRKPLRTAGTILRKVRSRGTGQVDVDFDHAPDDHDGSGYLQRVESELMDFLVRAEEHGMDIIERHCRERIERVRASAWRVAEERARCQRLVGERDRHEPGWRVCRRQWRSDEVRSVAGTLFGFRLSLCVRGLIDRRARACWRRLAIAEILRESRRRLRDRYRADDQAWAARYPAVACRAHRAARLSERASRAQEQRAAAERRREARRARYDA